MKSVGLQPSSTGMVGGKETGQHVSHYVVPNGRFARAFAKLAATGWRLNLQSAHQVKPKSPTSKIKYTCPSCALNVWGKPDIEVVCKQCGTDMQAAESELLEAAE